MTVFAEIRAAAARVAGAARCVRIDAERARAVALELAEAEAPPAGLDPAHHHIGDADETVAFVVTLDAVNFGSGYFPHLRKRAGASGYFTIAGALADHYRASGVIEAAALQRLGPEGCARLFGQSLDDPAVAELMTLFARSLADLGAHLAARYGGAFAALVEEAGASAARLVGLLAEMPMYRDVSRYAGAPVPFYKRAQITAADLALAFDGRGPGRFTDLDEMTIFADNLVPHVLRRLGVLEYAPALLARVQAGELLEAGEPAEVEIRAVALHAVEIMAEVLRAEASALTPRELDHRLWNRGQSPRIKDEPRHRTRCAFY